MARKTTPGPETTIDAGQPTVQVAPDVTDDARDPVRRALDVLNTIAHHGMVDVIVLIAHDGLFVDDRVSLPVCERTAGLLEIGYVDIAVPESP